MPAWIAQAAEQVQAAPLPAAPHPLYGPPAPVPSRALTAPTSCPEASGDEIIVCKRRDDAERYRLRPLAGDPRWEPGPPAARLDLGKKQSLSIEAQPGTVPGFGSVPRAVITWSLRF